LRPFIPLSPFSVASGEKGIHSYVGSAETCFKPFDGESSQVLRIEQI
jgi:hypothetical protein